MTGPHDYDSARLTTRTARADEIDALGHVNNAVYVRWVQDAGVEHWLAEAPAELKARVHWVCLRHEVDYREPVLEGESVEVRTWLGRARGPRFDRHVDVRKPGGARFSCRAVTTWALVDAKTGRPLRVTNDILVNFGLDPQAHRD